MTYVGSDWRSLAHYIDHTQLKTDAHRDQIEQLCLEARTFEFASVCVQPYWVPLCASMLAGSPVKVCTVIGFPQGAVVTEDKEFEAKSMLHLGAQELDMVMNISAFKSGYYTYVENEIRSLAAICHNSGALLKVIIECCLLSDEEKKHACELCLRAGADFVKTSTGMSTSGAKVEDIRLMRAVVGQRMGVKAAGGIRTAADMLNMIDAGASRIGASASVAIMQELEGQHELQPAH